MDDGPRSPGSPGEGAKPPLLLVHGAWHGPWCFKGFAPHLEARGFAVATAAFPDGVPGGTPPQELLAVYTDVVAAAARCLPAPPVIIAHSMAGAPVSCLLASTHEKIAGAIFLTAYALRPGESVMDHASRDAVSQIAQAFRPRPDGLVALDGDLAPALLYNNASAADAATAAAQLRPQDMAIFKARVPAPAGNGSAPAGGQPWRAAIVCTEDITIGPATQSAMAEATGCRPIVEMACDHSPFLSAPEALADVVAGICAEHCGPALR